MHFKHYLLFAVALASVDASTPCPLIGPDYASPQHPSNSSAIQSGISKFGEALAAALNASSDPFVLDSQATTFSFEAWSIHEQPPLFAYHHDAPQLSNSANGTTSVDSNTIYRIGSFSKLLTVYTWLAALGEQHWDEPITSFIPELAEADTVHASTFDSIDNYQWSDITIRSLASSLSGVTKDPAIPAALYSQLTPIANLPPTQDIASNATGLTCSTYAHIPCARSNFIRSILANHPVFAAQASQPVYSDSAIALLAIAAENITGTRFEDLMSTQLLQPLNLSNTYYGTPPPSAFSNSIIPYNDSFASFTSDLSYIQPAGGFYSTLSDITIIGRSILSSTVLSTIQTRTWLKPAQFLSGPNSAVGAPWEIYQTQPQGSTNKTTWVYTKSGDFGAYASYLTLLPDYDAGFSILAAGGDPSNTVRRIADIATNTFAPALEQAAKEEAASRFGGTYEGSFPNPASNATDSFEIVLTVDDGPGLRIQNYTVNGVDMIESFGLFFKTQVEVQLRLYPTGLTSPTSMNITNDQQQQLLLQGYRVIIYRPSATVDVPGDAGRLFSSPRCNEWFNIAGFSSRTDFGAAGGLDEFAFIVDKTSGNTTGLVVKTWKRTLDRVGTA